MHTRIAVSLAGALMLAALSPPGSAAAGKAACAYRFPDVSLSSDRERPAPEPAEEKVILAEPQRRLLVAAAMKDRAPPEAYLVRALAQMAGREPMTGR